MNRVYDDNFWYLSDEHAISFRNGQHVIVRFDSDDNAYVVFSGTYEQCLQEREDMISVDTLNRLF